MASSHPLFGLAFAAAVAGCSHANVDPAPRPAAATASPASASDPQVGYGCPTALPGAAASVTDIDNGVAVTFTGPANEEPALRSRAHWLTDQHALAMQRGTGTGSYGMPMMQGCPCMGGMGCGMMHGPWMQGGPGMMGMPSVLSDVAITDVPGGARVTLTARNAADIPALRSDVRARVAQMQSGICPML